MPHIPDNAHDTHDLELVAAYAAGDAEAVGLERATTLVATCTECATLHHDLRAIAAALPEVPALVRSRDFRLTPEQAASLRPGGIRGLLAAFSGPRFAFATPLGTGLAALGIVGVLVASGGIAPSGVTGERNAAVTAPGGTETFVAQAAPDSERATGAAQSAAPSAAAGGPAEAPVAVGPAEESPSVGVDTMGGGPAASAPASEAPAQAESSKAPAAGPSAPAPSANDQYLANLEASPGASSPAVAAPAPATLAGDSGTPQPGVILALALAIAGVVLVSLRWVARRSA